MGSLPPKMRQKRFFFSTAIDMCVCESQLERDLDGLRTCLNVDKKRGRKRKGKGRERENRGGERRFDSFK